MRTTTRTIGNADAARIKAALLQAGVRYGEQRDGNCTTLIFLIDDAEAASQAIYQEMAR